jgi:UrcA family protein
MRRTLATALTAAATLAFAAPALAQSVNEVTVTGQYIRQGDAPASLSRVVAYGDLDLSRGKDRALLKERISYTARRICTELGEPQSTHANLGKSCQEVAIRDAMGQFESASVGSYATVASTVVTNGPVPDTRQNRAAYGGPQSRAGRASSASGN